MHAIYLLLFYDVNRRSQWFDLTGMWPLIAFLTYF